MIVTIWMPKYLCTFSILQCFSVILLFCRSRSILIYFINCKFKRCRIYTSILSWNWSQTRKYLCQLSFPFNPGILLVSITHTNTLRDTDTHTTFTYKVVLTCVSYIITFTWRETDSFTITPLPYEIRKLNKDF
jgi:hypothetical protein